MKKQLIIASVFTAVIGAFLLARIGPSTAPDFPTKTSLSGAAEVVIDIPAGSAGSAIAKLLFDNGVVKSSESFFRVAVGDKRSEKIAPGNHRLTKEISAQQALEQLLDPERIPNLVRVFEGNWKSEIAKSLVTYGFSPNEVSRALANAKLPAADIASKYSCPSLLNIGAAASCRSGIVIFHFSEYQPFSLFE